MVFALLFLTAFLLLIFYNFYYKRRGLPPGPPPLPLIGNVLSLVQNPPGEKCFLEWRRRYGNVYTFWLGEQAVVCVAEHRAIIELFVRNGDAFAGRLWDPEFDRLTKGWSGQGGVIMMEGELWREHRRFTLHLLRDLGVGKNVMQERILDEFRAMAAKIDRALETDENQELDLAGEFIDPAVGSVINAILLGYRFDETNMDEFCELKELIREFMVLFSDFRMTLIMFGPRIFRWLPIFRSFLAKNRDIQLHFINLFARQIAAHRQAIEDLEDENAASGDYVEAFLRHQAKLERQGVTEHTFTEHQLKAVLLDLWFAGQETTSTTLGWALALLIRNPRVMEKIREEMDNALGEDPERLVTIEDRSKLPYLGAVINEVQRCTNLLPSNLVHRVSRDVFVEGYHLPAGIAIVPQISVVHIDPDVFTDPWEFRPERFLDENGKLSVPNTLMPFSIGKRQCIGEPLARYELFLFLGNLVRRYEISAGRSPPSLERRMAVTVPCPPFTCHVKKRRCLFG